MQFLWFGWIRIYLDPFISNLVGPGDRVQIALVVNVRHLITGYIYSQFHLVFWFFLYVYLPGRLWQYNWRYLQWYFWYQSILVRRRGVWRFWKYHLSDATPNWCLAILTGPFSLEEIFSTEVEAYRDKLRKRNRVITNIIQFNTKDDAHFSPRGDPILDD